MHRKAEGASILVMPIDFVAKTKMVFIRLSAATDLHGLLEVKIRSRFIVLIVGPLSRRIQLYEIGRAMSASIADDVRQSIIFQSSSIRILHQGNKKCHKCLTNFAKSLCC